MTASRIADDLGIPNHQAAADYLNRLLIDLKCIQLGHPPTQPITMERLMEGSKHVQDLDQCRRPGRVY